MSKKLSILTAILLIVVGVLTRLAPHPWNTTPIIAFALFASVYLGIKYSLFIVAGTMFISDLFIGFYDWQVMFSVYAGFAVAGIICIFVRKHKTIINIALGA